MTAYRLHFEKTNLEAMEIARSGKLGEPRIFQSAFTMQVKAGNIRLGPPRLGGGPIYDIGVYCINAARSVFREEPTEVVAFSASIHEKRFEQTTEMMSCTLRFPKERLASFTCSAGAADTGWYQIVGTKGNLRVDPAYEFSEGLNYELTVDGKSRRRSFPKRDQFAPELSYFSECVLAGRDPEPSGREGLADVRVVRALLQSVQDRKPVRLGAFERRQRPRLSMEARRPPISMPPLIHAEAPSAN
jgi:glucose-fructose oxidoreductase